MGKSVGKSYGTTDDDKLNNYPRVSKCFDQRVIHNILKGTLSGRKPPKLLGSVYFNMDARNSLGIYVAIAALGWIFHVTILK